MGVQVFPARRHRRNLSHYCSVSCGERGCGRRRRKGTRTARLGWRTSLLSLKPFRARVILTQSQAALPNSLLSPLELPPSLVSCSLSTHTSGSPHSTSPNELALSLIRWRKGREERRRRSEGVARDVGGERGVQEGSRWSRLSLGRSRRSFRVGQRQTTRLIPDLGDCLLANTADDGTERQSLHRLACLPLLELPSTRSTLPENAKLVLVLHQAVVRRPHIANHLSETPQRPLATVSQLYPPRLALRPLGLRRSLQLTHEAPANSALLLRPRSYTSETRCPSTFA